MKLETNVYGKTRLLYRMVLIRPLNFAWGREREGRGVYREEGGEEGGGGHGRVGPRTGTESQTGVTRRDKLSRID